VFRSVAQGKTWNCQQKQLKLIVFGSTAQRKIWEFASISELHLVQQIFFEFANKSNLCGATKNRTSRIVWQVLTK
jgi:hypothetical protein